MNEFYFVNYAELNQSQINQVADLMFETGYYDYVSFDNKLHLQPVQFQIEQTLLPCAKYTQALINKDGILIGFFTAATHEQVIWLKENSHNWYSDQMDIKIFQKKLFHFYIYGTQHDDFILHETALDTLWRGKGLFHILYAELRKLALQNKCKRIVFAVWESKLALKIYLHCGAKVIGKLDFSHLGFKDSLITCYFEI